MVRSSESRGQTSKRGRNNKNNNPSNPAATKPDVKHHEVEGYKSGDACPACLSGKLEKKDPITSKRVEAQQPYKATIHILKRLQCSSCGHIVSASLPDDVRKDGQEGQAYGFSARSMMSIQKHHSGTPFFHQQNLNSLFGCPITASTISDQCEHVADDSRLAHQQLKYAAANAILFHIDDTHHRILNAEPKIKDKRNGKGKVKRTGVYTSGLIAVLPDGKTIHLFDTSIAHSGEQLDEILRLRKRDLPPPIIACDALGTGTK